MQFNDYLLVPVLPWSSPAASLVSGWDKDISQFLEIAIAWVDNSHAWPCHHVLNDHLSDHHHNHHNHHNHNHNESPSSGLPTRHLSKEQPHRSHLRRIGKDEGTLGGIVRWRKAFGGFYFIEEVVHFTSSKIPLKTGFIITISTNLPPAPFPWRMPGSLSPNSPPTSLPSSGLTWSTVDISTITLNGLVWNK